MINQRVKSLSAYANDRVWIDASDAGGLRYNGMTPASLGNFMAEMDAKWAGSPPESL